ncbi:hypothetical protein GPL15_08455, partial [Clostridium sp. MCC353]|uniref:hypothetical protein n=1 Tax=Clostridium sp. MCC353 TaxID=2592646 RepID=UPI001C034F43
MKVTQESGERQRAEGLLALGRAGRGLTDSAGNRLPTVSETKAAGMEKDGPMPIHGKLFMGLYRSVG